VKEMGKRMTPNTSLLMCLVHLWQTSLWTI
jgi:hypothetical protein